MKTNKKRALVALLRSRNSLTNSTLTSRRKGLAALVRIIEIWIRRRRHNASSCLPMELSVLVVSLLLWEAVATHCRLGFASRAGIAHTPFRRSSPREKFA